MNKTAKYKIVIFDFDGTIADTAECIVETAKATLVRLGLPMRTDEEIRYVIGLPLEGCFEAMVPDADEDTISRCCEVYRELFFSYQEKTIRLFPEVKETLKSIHEAGIIIAIATSRGSKSLGELCVMLGLDEYVQMRMTTDLVVEKKPAPEMVNKILENYNLIPSEALVVGDTIFDIEMGQRAFCDTCGVTYGNQTRQQLKEKRPTFIIDRFGELSNLL